MNKKAMIETVKYLLCIRRVLVTLAIIVFSKAGFAQSKMDSTQNRNYLREFGLSSNATILNGNSRTKVCVGGHIYFNIPMSKRLGIQLGPELSCVRFHRDYVQISQLQSMSNVTYSINVLSASILLKLFLDRNNTVGFSFGVFGDYVMSAKRKGLKSTYIPSQGVVETIETERVNVQKGNFGTKGNLFWRIYRNELVQLNIDAGVMVRLASSSDGQTPISTSISKFGLTLNF